MQGRFEVTPFFSYKSLIFWYKLKNIMIMNYIYHGLASYTRKSKKMKQVKIDVVKRTFAY